MFGAIAGGIASALAGGAMSKLFGGGQKAASGGIQGDVLATDNNTVGMGDAGIKSAIQGSNVPNPDEAVPSFRSEERFSRNAETDLVCRLLLEKKNKALAPSIMKSRGTAGSSPRSTRLSMSDCTLSAFSVAHA